MDLQQVPSEESWLLVPRFWVPVSKVREEVGEEAAQKAREMSDTRIDPDESTHGSSNDTDIETISPTKTDKTKHEPFPTNSDKTELEQATISEQTRSEFCASVDKVSPATEDKEKEESDCLLRRSEGVKISEQRKRFWAGGKVGEGRGLQARGLDVIRGIMELLPHGCGA